jgi:hypothetical protein
MVASFLLFTASWFFLLMEERVAIRVVSKKIFWQFLYCEMRHGTYLGGGVRVIRYLSSMVESITTVGHAV